MNCYKFVRLDLWGGTSGTFNGLDIFNRIVDQRWQNSVTGTPADIDRFKYGYDLNSNRQWKQNTVGSTLDEYYTYDNLNRLIEMQRGTLNGGFTGITGTPVREMDYTLDPTGNWPTYLTKTSGTTDLNQGRTSNTVNEITAITASGGTPVWATPAYDAAGNMTTLPQPASLTSSYTATYDAWNRMTQISASSVTVAKYQYDGMNRRIVKLTYTSGTLSETRHFYYTNNWQDIEERTGTNTTMDRQFVWGVRYIDELVCRDDATPLRLYATQDANYNLTALTNTSGAVQQRFQYDPYGNSTVLTSGWSGTTDAYAWTIRFTGQFFDSETQLYCYRNRYLHSMLGTFIVRDLSDNGTDLNLYQYTYSCPITFLDPTGRTVAISGNGIRVDINQQFELFGIDFGAVHITGTGSYSTGAVNIPQKQCNTSLVGVPVFTLPSFSFSPSSASIGVGFSEGPLIGTISIGLSFPNFYTLNVTTGATISIAYLYWSGTCCTRLAASLTLSSQNKYTGALAAAAVAIAVVAPQVDLGAIAINFGGESSWSVSRYFGPS